MNSTNGTITTSTTSTTASPLRWFGLPTRAANFRLHLGVGITSGIFLVVMVVVTLVLERRKNRRPSQIHGRSQHWLLHYPLLLLETFAILYHGIVVVHLAINVVDPNFPTSTNPGQIAFVFVETIILAFARLSTYSYYLFRVYLVFRRTAFEIPRRFVRIFQVMVIIQLILLCALFNYTRANRHTLFPLLIAGFIIDMVIQSLLVALFIRRLLQTAAIKGRTLDPEYDPGLEEDKAVKVATRSFLLLITSTTIMLFFFVFLSLIFQVFFFTLELTIQVTLVFLSLSVYSSIYTKVCCCDERCRLCFAKLADGDCGNDGDTEDTVRTTTHTAQPV